MKRIILVLLLVSFCLLNFGMIVYAQNINIVEPKGVFAEIDVQKSNEAVMILQGRNKKSKEKIIKEILASPNDYNPTVLYVLSNELFKKGQKDEGAFWFYVGQLRARIDANICADITARGAVSILNNEYGMMINKYTIPRIELLEEIVMKVIEFVRNNNENYDRRWINLHGMWVFRYSSDDNKDLQLSLPDEQWEDIKEKTINDYYKGFKEALASLKANS